MTNPPEFPDRLTVKKHGWSGFGETVVVAACRLAKDPASALAACRRARADREEAPGDDDLGLRPEDLCAVNFPFRVFVERRQVPVTSPHLILTKFTGTALYAAWRDLRETVGGGSVTLCFRWSETPDSDKKNPFWGTCALTDAEWAAGVPAVVVLRPHEDEELFLLDWEVMVKNSGWSYLE